MFVIVVIDMGCIEYNYLNILTKNSYDQELFVLLHLRNQYYNPSQPSYLAQARLILI